jgi:MoaA/NifB/PqqE/SkfB family radical SAM enzyme
LGDIVIDSDENRVRHWLGELPSTIVLQSTTRCPLNCDYCNLPRRHLTDEMSPTLT